MKNKFDVVVIGSIALDKNKIYFSNKKNFKEWTAPGGGVHYSSIPLAGMGLKVAVITRLAFRDVDLLNEFCEEGIQIFYSWSNKTTEMRNIYPDVKNPDKRICKCLISPSPFELREIPKNIKAKIFHITSLVRGEIPFEVIKKLSRKGKISLDVQGFIRRFQGKNKEMKIDEWKEKAEILSMVDILKVDKIEAEILTGQKNPKKALKTLASFGPREILLTSQKGVLVYAQRKFYSASFIFQCEIEGRTGRGDTAIGAYLGQRLLGRSSEYACHFAAIVSSIKMKNKCPFKHKKERPFVK